MSKYRFHSGPVFFEAHADRQLASVVMEAAKLVLSQFKNFLKVFNWKLNKIPTENN